MKSACVYIGMRILVEADFKEFALYHYHIHILDHIYIFNTNKSSINQKIKSLIKDTLLL